MTDVPGYLNVIAARRGGRYSAPVGKLVFHRWAVVLLLVSRLIFGEVVHAMPQADSAKGGEAALAIEQAAPCPNHSSEGAEPVTARSGDSLDAQSTQADEDCCKEGGCNCPCVHVPAAALAPLVMNLAHLDRNRLVDCADGVAALRLNALFRPPA